MDPHLLHYYNEELIYMRELGGEFAALHPKIARRLGMQAGEVRAANMSARKCSQALSISVRRRIRRTCVI
jgi:hypothetical protein